MRLNGWQRIAVLACAAWLIGSVAIFATDWIDRKDGHFVFLSLPSGTLIEGSTATLPDGRKVALNQRLNGKELKPWEIKWDDEPEIPPSQHIRWRRLLLLGIAPPLAGWLALELAVLLVAWVRRGFVARK